MSAEPIPTPIRAGVYCRISRDRTGRQAGVTRQEADCRDLAARLGWDVADVYVDNDVSAYSGKKRPAYERLKADLEAGRIQAVVAWHPDRLYRRAKELEAVVDLVAQVAAEVATVQAGAVDLATPNGRLVARIGAAVAQHESEHKAARVERWHLQRAEAGLPGGSKRPYGYDSDRVTVRPEEAAMIREAARRVLAGEKRWAICEDWNDRGVPTKTGVPWSPIVLGEILRNPRLAGLREHKGRRYTAVWEPILDMETWESVQAALKVERPKVGRRATYELTGLLECGRCGGGMTGSRTAAGVRQYRCPRQRDAGHCGRVAVNAENIELWVRDEVLAVLGPAPTMTEALRARATGGDDTAELLAALASLEGRLERLKTEYAVEGAWSKTEFGRLRGELEARIGEIGARLTAVQDKATAAALPVGVDLAEWWEGAGPIERRRVASIILNKITVDPAGRGGKGLDARRLTPDWRR